ncbi:stage V sporulation protein AE [Alicyclobacillus tolerans]|uniref:stage V sporulation protein AE n=1 Tax=Alicyclobacillus tolerans TaxID=90970 RepID=UPI003B766D3F
MRNRQRKRRVIVVTDGDSMALRALKMAAKQTGCRLISRSAGSPTPLSGPEIVHWIQRAQSDPVIIMFDDNGNQLDNTAEISMSYVLSHPSIEVIGVLAVASNAQSQQGIQVHCSVTPDLRIVTSAVNKEGWPTQRFNLKGDTVDILRKFSIPMIVGIGDLGKMHGNDAPAKASPVTTKAIQLILKTQQSPQHSCFEHIE